MRILHLTTLLQGGAGRAIADLACAQQRAGHWVDVVTSATAPEGYGNYPAYLTQLRDAGVDLHLVDSMFSRELAANLQVVQHILDRDLLSGTTVVHAHAATPALVALMAKGASGRRVPVVETMHGWGLRKTAAQQHADVAIMNIVERLVVPASSSAEVLRRAGVSRPDIAVVAYGVEDDPASVPADDVRGLVESLRRQHRTVFCCVGTIGERKNQVAIVEAIARIDHPSRVACLFVGDGDAAPLVARAQALGVGHAVHALGYRADAPAIAAAADWYILPSRSEGQPLSILEAYRDGVPVMASRIPELSELVEDGSTGLLFDQEAPADLAARMDDAVRMTAGARDAQRARARRRFETSFTLQAMVHGYVAEYARAREAMHAAVTSTGSGRMSVPAAFTEAMIQRNCDALRRAQGSCPPMSALQPGTARAVPDASLGIRVELRTRDDRWLPLDGSDPVATAADRVAPLVEQKQIVLVGLGLGYALDRLDAAGSQAKVLAFEPDPAVATLCLARRDWSGWIDSGRLRLLVGPDYAGATSMARWVDVTTPPAVSVSDLLASQRPKSTQGARTVAERVIGDAEANLEARRRFAGRYLLQTLGNLPVLLRESNAAALDGLFAGIPAVVVGAGPSLDENVRALARLQDRAVIIAADTTLRPLLAGGVRPHLVVGVDPAELNARHVAGVGGVDDTWLVGEGSLHPSAFEGFTGRTFTFKVSRHEPWPWLEGQGAARGTLRAWGSVITSAFDLALRLGCTPVTFAGLDLAYTGERPYCSNTLYDTTWRDVLMACHGWTFEQLVADYFAQRTTSWEPDLHGTPVRTAPQLLSFRNWLLDQMAQPSPVRFVNGTGGGLLYGPGVEQCALDDVLGDAPVQADIRERLRAAHASGRSAHTVSPDDLTHLAVGDGPAAAALLERWRSFTLDTVDLADIRAALQAAAAALA